MELAEISSSQYATRRKELLALLKQLRATGSQGELDLPRITVIGNQSAGKSSVVEAISGISVPRDAGTCTRCPMECRLSASSRDWSCQISIRREFDELGNVLGKVLEIPFGEVITNENDVEPALRRAQIAVLNPHIPLESIASQSMAKLLKQPYALTPSLPFSRDTICVDLEGPELTDLAFIDLPGLIQNADPQVVNMVEAMVKSHISTGLILVALPMTDDIENQKALWLANEADPGGSRTIGVLTKPDMLLPSSIKATELWLDVIEGRRHPLTHGYYCTRRPDDSERNRGITPGKARDSEIRFFSKTAPWSTSTEKNRFGTKHLISTLSTLLVGMIHNVLPKINEEAQRLLGIVNQDLATMPKELDSEPATYMLGLISSFCDDVQRQVLGGFDVDVGSLVQKNRDSYVTFKQSIRQTAPNFIPLTKPPSPVSVFGMGPVTVKLPRGQVDGGSNAAPFYLNDMRLHIKSSALFSFVVSLFIILITIRVRCIARELPNNVPFLAKERLIVEFQETWESAIRVCFLTVHNSTKTAVDGCIEKRFKQFGKLGFDVRKYVYELIDQQSRICTEVLFPILEAEKTPFTQNTHYFSESCTKWLAKYKDMRTRKSNVLEPPSKKLKMSEDSLEANGKTSSSAFGVFGDSASTLKASKFSPQRNSGPFTDRKRKSFAELMEDTTSERDARVTNVLASLTDLGFVGLTATDLGKLNPPDEYETELQAMAEIRGYFKVAYKRIIDIVPSIIDFKFVKPIGKELQAFLVSKFALGAADANSRCAIYLAENPMDTAKRKELVARKERLNAVQKALRDFGLK